MKRFHMVDGVMKCNHVIGYIYFPDDPTFYTESRRYEFEEDKKDALGLLVIDFEYCSLCGEKILHK